MNIEDPESVEYRFITITPMSTLIRNVSNSQGFIYGSV